MVRMSGWGRVGVYKSKAGALSSLRSMNRRMAVDRIKHPDWSNPHYETEVVKSGKGFDLKYRYPLKKGEIGR